MPTGSRCLGGGHPLPRAAIRLEPLAYGRSPMAQQDFGPRGQIWGKVMGRREAAAAGTTGSLKVVRDTAGGGEK